MPSARSRSFTAVLRTSMIVNGAGFALRESASMSAEASSATTAHAELSKLVLHVHSLIGVVIHNCQPAGDGRSGCNLGPNRRI